MSGQAKWKEQQQKVNPFGHQIVAGYLKICWINHVKFFARFMPACRSRFAPASNNKTLPWFRMLPYGHKTTGKQQYTLT